MDLKNNRQVKKIQISTKGLELLKDITAKVKSYVEEVTTTVSKDEIEKIRKTLKIFRLNLKNVVEMNI